MIGAHEVARVERDVWSREAVSTAAIEGETLDLASVQSSVGRRLGIAADFVAKVPRNVEGLLDVMESAAADRNSELTTDRLNRWQASLFPAGGSALRPVATGRYREHVASMEIVSGPVGRETVHYVAPPSAAVRAEFCAPASPMCGSRRYIPMKMATAGSAGGAGDVTEWLAWFADAFADSCRASTGLIGESLERARFWSDHKDVVINQRQRKVLGKMLDAGPGQFEEGLTARKYVAMTGISAVTAWRDIEDLLSKKLITQGRGAGRATHYNIGIAGWEWRGGDGV
jgi:Fic family protein